MLNLIHVIGEWSNSTSTSTDYVQDFKEIKYLIDLFSESCKKNKIMSQKLNGVPFFNARSQIIWFIKDSCTKQELFVTKTLL